MMRVKCLHRAFIAYLSISLIWFLTCYWAFDLSKSGSSSDAAWKLRRMELRYAVMRERIARVCDSLRHLEEEKDFKEKYLKVPVAKIAYINESRVAYCQIPKASSSTWTRNFMLVGGRTPHFENHDRVVFDFPMPKNDTRSPTEILHAPDLTTVIFVRHPLSRLVSAYHSKMLAMGFEYHWITEREKVIRKFRLGGEWFLRETQNMSTPKMGNYDEEDPRYVTPNEFLQYALGYADQHWRPQSQQGGFCAINYTIYSKIEDDSSDKEYLETRIKMNITKLLRDYHGTNQAKKEPVSTNKYEGDVNDRDRRFWSKVEVGVLMRILDYYKVDFKMLDYSASDYFKTINLTWQF